MDATTPAQQAAIYTLTPDLLGYIFTLTKSNVAESFVSQQFYQAARTELVCQYFFSELRSIVGEDYSDEFDSLIDRQEGDSWFVVNKKAIKYFKDLNKLLGYGPIVIPKLNEDYFSISLISIFQQSYQKFVDRNFINCCHSIDNNNLKDLLSKNRTWFTQELSALLRDCLKKNNILPGKRFNLSGRNLSLLPSEVCGFTTLENLELTSNPLRTLPHSFSKLENLTELTLYLGQNRPEKFPSALLTLRALKTLSVTGEQRITFPETFGNLTTLTNFTLCSKTLKNLPQSFSSFQNLARFCIIDTPIENFPSCLLGLSNLRSLSIKVSNWNKGNIQPMKFPTSFECLTNLTALSLERYPITNPPESLGSLVNLIELTLASTKIEVLPTWIFKLTNLGLLNYDYTPLSRNGSITKEVLNSLHKGLPNLYYPRLCDAEVKFSRLR